MSSYHVICHRLTVNVCILNMLDLCIYLQILTVSVHIEQAEKK